MTQLKATAMKYPHYYAWKNNSKRKTLYQRRMRVILRAGPNSALVEFEDGQREVISRNAIRRVQKNVVDRAV